MRYIITVLVSCWFSFLFGQTIPIGHAHNDYLHKHPLTDALSFGFKSVEIDVFLHKGKLVVAHVPIGLDSKKDIVELYLEPIKKRIELNGGAVYKGDSTPLIFMIDFKTNGDSTYSKLEEVLQPYKKYLTTYDANGNMKFGALSINISGRVPANVLGKTERWVTIDGNISNRNDATPANFMERVSSPYSSYFSWKGMGTMPKEQKALLLKLTEEAHAHGRQIRFYALPQNEAVWLELLDAGVDWLNIDKLEKFANFWSIYGKVHGRPKSCHCVRL
jgi:glycerophosphoryl diester phosphodiesterase